MTAINNPRGKNWRIIADSYSSRQVSRELTRPYGADRLLGRIRFDSLLAAEIVLPDTHLFDSVFFMEEDPVTFFGKVARGRNRQSWPIRLALRKPTFSESLAGLLVEPGKQTLKRFPFRAIGNDAERRAISEEIAKVTTATFASAVGRHGAAGALSRLLADVSHGCSRETAATIATLSDGWQRWGDYVDVEERMPVSQYSATNFPLLSSLQEERLPDDRELRTAAGLELCEKVQRQIIGAENTHKATLHQIMDEARDQLESEDELADVRELEAWYERGRYRALGHQHDARTGITLDDEHPLDARTESFVSRWIAKARVASYSPDNDGVVEAPDNMLERIASLDADHFRQLCVAHAGDLDSWWTTGSEGALRRPLRAVYRATESVPGAASAPVDMLVNAGAAAAGAAAGPPFGVLSKFVGPVTKAIQERRVVGRLLEYTVRRTERDNAAPE
jgi:hypothetical protein